MWFSKLSSAVSLAEFSCASHPNHAALDLTAYYFCTKYQGIQIVQMARQRKEPRKAKDIKLRQPDRSAPTEKTLLQLAEDRNLFDLADKHQRRNKAKDGHDEEEEDDGSEDDVAEDQSGDDVLSSSADRLMDTLLYSVCLAMLHFTLDFLVQHQYAMKMDYGQITLRAIQSLVGELRCLGLFSCWSWYVWLSHPLTN